MSTFYREVLCYSKITIVTLCTVFTQVQFVLSIKLMGYSSSNGDINILRGRSLLCETGYAVGRICFCCKGGWLYAFSTVCIGSKLQQCASERGVWESFVSLKPSLPPSLQRPGTPGKVWAILAISIYFKAGILKVCSYRLVSTLLLEVQARY